MRERQNSRLSPGVAATSLAVAMLVATTLVAVALGTGPQTQRVALAVETFDEAWRIIHETHFDLDFNGVDWEALREELRPRAEAAESVGELRVVINDMLDRLGQSHFALWPSSFAAAVGEEGGAERRTNRGTGEPGFTLLQLDDAFVVAKVEPGGAAAAAGVRPGWIVRRVGDVDLWGWPEMFRERFEEHDARIEAERAARGVLRGRTGSEVKVGFLDGNDEPADIVVERARPPGTMTRFGNLPPIIARLEHEIRAPDVDLEVGVIAFNVWLPVLAGEFDAAVDTMRDVDGVVIDLRANPGGVGGMVMGVGGHFVQEFVTLGTMRDRRNELRFVANPRRVSTEGQRVEPYAGPLAILIDSSTASTSEVFAGGMQSIGRARVFGERSMGAVLPSLMDRLPNGDILQHAIADFTVAETEERLEGRGVIPDEEVTITREGLLAGRDPIMRAAMAWISAEAERRNR